MSPQANQLQEVMQWHFPWHKARVKFTCLRAVTHRQVSAFILSLIKLTTVNFSKLANVLNGKAKQKSNYHRIQRFFSGFHLPYDRGSKKLLYPLSVLNHAYFLMNPNREIGVFTL